MTGSGSASGSGNILRISHAEAAHSSDCGLALVEADEAAIGGVAEGPTIIRAPRIILRLGAPAGRYCHSDDS